jgi:hypothetical protein
MRKVVHLAQISLTPEMLFGGGVKADAPAGIVHATATRVVIDDDGEEYPSVATGSDCHVKVRRFAETGRELFQHVAQQLANDAGCDVEYTVRGTKVVVTPSR